jgi:hypothetical protein
MDFSTLISKHSPISNNTFSNAMTINLTGIGVVKVAKSELISVLSNFFFFIVPVDRKNYHINRFYQILPT